ncbi:MAG: acetylxylan esterase [Lentisphaeria bacterium]|nr:acetylxylan esterase [Lentisphaeria bacterium]
MLERCGTCAAIWVGAALAAAEPVYVAEGPELEVSGRNAPLVITAANRDHRGKCGETVRFRVDPVAPPPGTAAVRIFRWVNLFTRTVEDHGADRPFTVTMSSSHPAHLAVTGVYVDASGKEIAPPSRLCPYGDGVLIEPDRLGPVRPIPGDFDAFWARELRKLAAIPLTATRRTIARTDKWRGEDVEIPAVDGIPVKGYLVMPPESAERSLPAVVYFHGAGFKSAQLRTELGDRAIVFDVNAHGVPNGMPSEFYKELNRNPPPDRRTRSGRDDREKSYFKNMFLRTARALDFVKSLPEWDGRTLIVAGRSQGGAQALAAAALVPEVTLCIANVPALADHGGAAANRRPGWPQLVPESDPKIAAASDYVDVIHLASRIRCEVLMSAGLVDTICPPASVYLVYRNIRTKKHLTLFPRMGHNAPPPAADGRKRIAKEVKP